METKSDVSLGVVQNVDLFRSMRMHNKGSREGRSWLIRWLVVLIGSG